jgi:phosphate transport system substrate-binding protein
MKRIILFSRFNGAFVRVAAVALVCTYMSSYANAQATEATRIAQNAIRAQPAQTETVRPTIQIDATLPEYRRSSDVSGKLRSVGSSALTQLLNRWTEEFKRIHPNFELEVIGGGSGTAPPALTEGNSELAPMSRPMNENELKAFRAKYGYEPMPITVTVDALAIYVNKSNPLQRISLRELDALYSLTRKRGGGEIKNWGDLGATGEWASKPIRVFGPQSTQGMYGVFRAEILQGGEYRYDMRTEPVASAIVQGVGADELAIGFASHSLATARTKALAVSEEPSGAAIPPTHATVLDDSYPLARKLVIYVNRKPNTPLTSIVSEFLKFACSKQGQRVAIELNGYPLNTAIAEKACLNVSR